MAKKVLVGFSGGVDSATAALLLRERGFAVTAVMMSVLDASGRGCGAAEGPAAARELADRLDLPFRVIDCSAAYREKVLGYFRSEYLAGRTPNPCVRCNVEVKFGLLPRLAREAGLEFDVFATGHYARVEYDAALGRHVLLRGVDAAKDQSYFLYRLSPETLAGTLFPLGGLCKSEVRRLAAERGAPVFDKPDSQDFYAGDYADLLGVGEMEGEIVDVRGKVLGRHGGYWRFTPGQRKGLGVAFGEALYVLRLEPGANRVVVGTRDEMSGAGCVIGELCFWDGVPASGSVFAGRLRSSQALREMIVGECVGGGLEVWFRESVHGVAPGQSLVFYDGDRVVGGGVIEAGRHGCR